MMTKPKEGTLQNKIVEKTVGVEQNIDPELLAEQLGAVEKTTPDVYGEIEIRQTPETAVLAQIEKHREDLERERGDTQKNSAVATAAADDAAMTTTDDSSDDAAVPVKYYGYKIPAKILEALGVSTTINLELADDWLKVWLARVMEKVS